MILREMSDDFALFSLRILSPSSVVAPAARPHCPVASWASVFPNASTKPDLSSSLIDSDAMSAALFSRLASAIFRRMRDSFADSAESSLFLISMSDAIFCRWSTTSSFASLAAFCAEMRAYFASTSFTCSP